jgi:excisionase family DNA binding protein
MQQHESHHTAFSELLSREEAARYLGVSASTLAVWKSTGRYLLPVVKIGRLVKYRKRDLDAFIARGLIGGVDA